MGPHTAIRRAAPHRRSVFLSRTADHAEIHRHSAGDQYFLPDSSQFYFDGLRGEYLRYLTSTDHSRSYRAAAESALAFCQSILTNTPRPRFAWDFEPDGSIRVKTETRPNIVTLWQAHNPDARDFRLEKIDQRSRVRFWRIWATASMLAQCRRRRRAGQPTSSR